MTDDGFPNHPLSRRRMLGLMAAGGTGLLAAACGVSTSTNQIRKVNAGDFKISRSGARLPTGDVSLTWMDSGDQKAVFFDAFFPAYTKKHPNIKIAYTGTNWNTIQQTVLLGMENGSAPDVFQLPPSVTAPQAVQNKWVGAFDDLIPNFADLKKKYPVGSFANGVTDFGGKTYGMPVTSNTRIGNFMLYDTQYMKAAGYEPSKEPLTWDEFRTALKKITKAGDGKYFGIIAGLTQAGQLSGVVDTLAEMAGAHGIISAATGPSAPSPYTGNYMLASDQYQAATELLLAIKSDGSFFPGSSSIDAPGARSRFPLGVAGVIMQGPWNIPAWRLSNPDFPLGLAMPPVQKSLARSFPLSRQPGGSNVWFRSVNTKLGPVIGDIFHYLSTLNGQIQWAEYDGGGDPPAFTEALKYSKLDPLSARAADFANKYTVLLPYPPAKNAHLSTVLQLFKTPTPDWSDTMVGLFTGQISTSPKAALAAVQSRYEQALETAIKAANAKLGTHITQDDFKVPGWNPRQSDTGYYTSS
ncbi:MAG: extracellular solute-binding protein [Candidatus Dormibacteraeota bacterium]|nr:extracellular solute-binding protein [Candidatus Dormibacteraeota bacterium]